MCTYTRREIVSVKGLTNNRVQLGTGIQNVVAFRIIKVLAPNNFFNIITGVNDSFQWMDSIGNTWTVYIPAGHYDYISFATAFDATVNGVGSADVFTTTFDINTRKYTITTSGAISPKWLSSTVSNRNVAQAMGFFNTTLGNEYSGTVHTSEFGAQLIPPYYLLRSKSLSAGRKSAGGGGGTQVAGIADQSYLTMLPNQADGTLATFAYIARDNDNDKFEFAGERFIDTIDFEILHPEYLDAKTLDDYTSVSVEIELICLNRFK